MGEIKPELIQEFEWRTYVQRHPGTCLLAARALGWILGRRLCLSRCSSTAEKSGSGIFDTPKNGGQSVFRFGRGPSLIAGKVRRFSKLTSPQGVRYYPSLKGRGGICSWGLRSLVQMTSSQLGRDIGTRRRVYHLTCTSDVPTLPEIDLLKPLLPRTPAGPARDSHDRALNRDLATADQR